MRRRILTSMVLVTLVAVVAFAVPLGFASARLYRGREVGRLERQATRAAGALPSGGLHGPDGVELPPSPPGMEVALYDDTGRRVVGAGPELGDTEVKAALTGTITNDRDGRWLAVAVPIQDEEHVVGAARAAVRWSNVTHDTYISWLVMAALGALAISLAAGFARWQSRRLVGPINDVAAMAVRLGEGDFSAQVGPAGVAELDRAGDALNRTALRLGEIVTRERAFTADVSHQLNTPLTSLRLGLESAILGGDHERALHRAVKEVERLQTTIATLFAVARDAQARADARCDLGAVCADVAGRMRSGLAVDGRPLRLAMDEGVPSVRCPPQVLHEILTILVDNGRRHGAGTVTIAARSAGHGAVVEVSDEGAGIAEPSSVFDRRTLDADGHGVGLALARSLAEAHDARLELTRGGAHPVFTLALPGSSS